MSDSTGVHLPTSSGLRNLKFRKKAAVDPDQSNASHMSGSSGAVILTFRSGGTRDLRLRRKATVDAGLSNATDIPASTLRSCADMFLLSAANDDGDGSSPLAVSHEQSLIGCSSLATQQRQPAYEYGMPMPQSEITSLAVGTRDHLTQDQLKRTRFDDPPATFGPWDGKVACEAGLSGFIVTSPNQDHVPKLPRDSDIIQTYVDGRWGIREYSRHPQWYIEEMTHIACILRRASPPDVPDILFATLECEKDWEEDRSVVVHGLGLIRESLRNELAEAADAAIRRTDTFRSESDGVMRYARFLVMLLRQVVDRMNYLRSVATRAVAVAAHIQRLCLQLAGLKTYLDIVVRRINSPENFSASVLDVVGGFLREGAVTQTWHRVGIPFWVLQPRSGSVAIWNIVQEGALPYDLAAKACDPPILLSSGALLGVSNLTGNWLSSMLVSVTQHIAGSHLTTLNFTTVPNVPVEAVPNHKRARLEEKPIVSKHLSMRMVEGEKRRPSGGRQRALRIQQANGGAGLVHPSRSHVLSAFIDVPQIWDDALRSASPVLPQTPDSARYFFPPPFLLDTVPSIDTVPPGCLHPDRLRGDAKVNRYLHNLVRIRAFCRTRLFDVSLDNRPLTIREWRAALWGDYNPQTSSKAGDKTAKARRAQRRLKERDGVATLLHRIANFTSYSETHAVEFEGVDVDASAIATNPAIRASLLWESHEVNFRAELLALDSLLVPSSDWMEIHRWEREMVVSGVWGLPSSAASVAAQSDPASRVFCWYSPPDELWQTCRDRLRCFARVLTRWPGCPEVVVQGGTRDLQAHEYQALQQHAVKFYVQTFVNRYSRLPIPPIASS